MPTALAEARRTSASFVAAIVFVTAGLCFAAGLRSVAG
jgi:hypothetical protein